MNRFPIEVPTERYPSVPRKTIFHRKRESVPPSPPVSVRPSARLRLLLICLIPVVGLCVALIAIGAASNGPDGWGQAFGQGILQGGLPPTGTDADTDTDSPETVAETWTETEESPTDAPTAEETLPREPETTAVETTAVETTAVETAEVETTEAEDPETQPRESGTDTESPQEPDTEPTPETDAPVSKDEPTVSVPEGCYPVITADMSRVDQGAGYIDPDLGVPSDSLPDVGRPTGSLWSTDGPPTVLIVNTHPYEGYSDGSAWYDPTAGGLAQTDSPSAAEGTVALGAALARSLRGMGVTVIHLRIAVSSDDSAADIYDRTETVIRSYCRLYPDIGLILDLRRTAELTADGGILRTEGNLGGHPCAQLRISVSGGREASATGGDLAVALALRSGLWDMAPTVSRPVRVKAGAGLAGDLDGIRVLTLDMGSAGNTYAEAARLGAPVAAVLSGLILDDR